MWFTSSSLAHDDVIKWKHFPRYWPFMRGIHRSPVNSTHKGQWRGALVFSLICPWINDWVNNREAGDLRRYSGYYDVSVMHTVQVSFCTRHYPFQRLYTSFTHGEYCHSLVFVQVSSWRIGNKWTVVLLSVVQMNQIVGPTKITLQWRHNWCDGVSNPRPHDCLFNRLFRRRSKRTSKLRVTGLCVTPWYRCDVIVMVSLVSLKLWSQPEQAVKQTVELLVILDAMTLIWG